MKDALRHTHKGILDVFATLGASLDVLEHAVAARPLLGLFLCHLALIVVSLRQISLVSDQHNDNVWLGNLAQVMQPVCDVLECLLAREVEDKQGAACTAEVGPCYGLVCFLAGRVPEA